MYFLVNTVFSDMLQIVTDKDGKTLFFETREEAEKFGAKRTYIEVLEG